MAVIDQLLQNAESYASGFDRGELPLPPARKIAVVACMDARLNPYGLLGLSEGDAHVIRNAGGGRFYLSGISSQARGVTTADVEGKPAEMAMPAKLVELAFEHDRVLTY